MTKWGKEAFLVVWKDKKPSIVVVPIQAKHTYVYRQSHSITRKYDIDTGVEITEGSSKEVLYPTITDAQEKITRESMIESIEMYLSFAGRVKAALMPLGKLRHLCDLLKERV